MAFYAQVKTANKPSNLESDLNDALAQYTGVNGVPGFGIAFGNGENHASVLVEATGTDGTDNEVWVKIWSDTSISDIKSDIEDWVADQQIEILGLSLYYNTNKDKYKVLVPYQGADSVTDYQVGYEKDNDDGDMANDIKNDLANATAVVGYGYTYHNGDSVALYIWY